MTPELYWLTLTALMTALFWAPYILNRIAVRGLAATLGNPSQGATPQTPWAERAMAAHRNAIENLAVFAALVLAANAAAVSNEVTATAAAVYFFARLTHFIVYTAGIPLARTLAFAAGAFSQLAIALALLGAV